MHPKRTAIFENKTARVEGESRFIYLAYLKYFFLTDLWFSCIRVYCASLSIKDIRRGEQYNGRFVLPIAVLAMAGVVAVTGASQVCSVARNRFALIRRWVSRTALWGKECVCSIRLAAVVPSRALPSVLSRARFDVQEVVSGEERTRWLIASPPLFQQWCSPFMHSSLWFIFILYGKLHQKTMVTGIAGVSLDTVTYTKHE